MKNPRRWMAGLFVASWMLLIFHAHPACAGDLHSEHAACQACASASRFSAPVLLPAADSVRAGFPLFSAAAETSVPSVRSASGLLPSVRAPPR
jgi:hypothetical protein